MANAGKIKFVTCRQCGNRIEGNELGQHIRRDHADVAWRLYAQVYLDGMWFGQGNQDKTLVEKFKSTVTPEILYELFTKYGVIRSFLRHVPCDGKERLQPFADMLNRYRNTPLTTANIPEIFEEELASLYKVYGKTLLSAITKAFRFMRPESPVAIYDANAWEGLRQRGLSPGYNGYRTYLNSWFRFFDHEDTKKGLDDALAWLPESPAAERLLNEDKSTQSEIKELASCPLIRYRSADMRLFYEGGGYLERTIKCGA